MRNPKQQPPMPSIMIFLGILAIGVIFAITDIPLAVSQPVTIPIASITGDIAMDAANPI
ncbi:MAG: hypothetical protein KIT39_00815 [Nitrospirales bacterium]|nr:hypothetical protein [Nitrospirales bacterium]